MNISLIPVVLNQNQVANLNTLIKALESDKYVKTRYSLCHYIQNNPCFCVQGVLCDICSSLGEGKWNREAFEYNNQEFFAYAPDDLTERIFGFDKLNCFKLQILNDSYNKSFKEIAHIIQEWMNKQKIVEF